MAETIRRITVEAFEEFGAARHPMALQLMEELGTLKGQPAQALALQLEGGSHSEAQRRQSMAALEAASHSEAQRKQSMAALEGS